MAPHIASATTETRLRMALLAAENLLAAFGWPPSAQRSQSRSSHLSEGFCGTRQSADRARGNAAIDQQCLSRDIAAAFGCKKNDRAVQVMRFARSSSSESGRTSSRPIPDLRKEPCSARFETSPERDSSP